MQKINFANMLSTRFWICILFLFQGNYLFCQYFELPDTSDYLPYFYEGANEYNLMIASYRGYVGEIEKLVARGADVNAETVQGATPLIFSVAGNKAEAVRKLLEYNPDIDKFTTGDETPLLIAVKNGNLTIAEILIRGGANIDLSNRKGVSALHLASIDGDFEMTDLLCYYGADVNLKSNDGTTPLMASIWAGYHDVADLLIYNGANLEARDRNGFTPFLIAAQNGDTMMINRLFREGVDLYETNNYKSNALTIAIESNHAEAVKLLLKLGDKWVSSESGGMNPHTIAASSGRKDILLLLEEKNIPGKTGFRIDEISFYPSIKFNSRDSYAGFNIMFREPVLKAGFKIGFDFKPVYSRVLFKADETHFYQYYDRSSIIYLGLFKDATLAESIHGIKISASAALNAGYSFGPFFRGTNLGIVKTIKLMPSVGFSFQKKRYTAGFDFEYMKTPFYGISPLWFRAGIGYNYYISTKRSPGKTIKWN